VLGDAFCLLFRPHDRLKGERGYAAAHEYYVQASEPVEAERDHDDDRDQCRRPEEDSS
jgi:hypothetical protein